MKCGRVIPVPMRFYHDFNILIERHEKAQKALDRKLPELAAQQLGDIGLASRFRGNDCSWERPRLANDTSTRRGRNLASNRFPLYNSPLAFE
jgi:hypothetical protein